MRIAVTVIGTNLVFDYGTPEAARAAMDALEAGCVADAHEFGPPRPAIDRANGTVFEVQECSRCRTFSLVLVADPDMTLDWLKEHLRFDSSDQLSKA